MLQSFVTFRFTTGLLADLRDDMHPSALHAWNHASLDLPSGGTHFGFCLDGEATLTNPRGSFPLSGGMYFSLPGSGRIESASGRGIIITRWGCDGLFMLGGPVEERGRLRYIDGCTDSLIIPPVVKGDPCLNLLHIPRQTHQTRHTHPSLRAGLILSGSGECVTPDGAAPLTPGMIFIIPAGGAHSFHTADEDLRVLAWHPDSDTGPTHEDHPMLNRTIIGGTPASQLAAQAAGAAR